MFVHECGFTDRLKSGCTRNGPSSAKNPINAEEPCKKKNIVTKNTNSSSKTPKFRNYKKEGLLKNTYWTAVGPNNNWSILVTLCMSYEPIKK